MMEPTMPAPASRHPSVRSLVKRLKLRHCRPDELKISRRRAGEGWIYRDADGSEITDAAMLKRFASLAVPPAYEDVLYAEDERAHLQAVGRDAAGRLQYRYHPDWTKVRESRKARQLQRLVEALPRIRRIVGKHLGAAEPTRAFALSAVIELVSSTAIRPGSESYAKANGTRGAATLLKSNIDVDGATITLKFRAKGGKDVEKEFRCPRVASAIGVLRQLPGRRMFQYRDESGAVRIVTTTDVNEFLR